MWREQWQIFLTAVMFLTRVPMPGSYQYQPHYLQASARYFPVVGLLVGALGGAVYLLFAGVLPDLIAILLSIAATLLVTGAFHEDGFADSCDGFGGGLDAQQVLTIMKDSRVGSYALVGLMLLLAIKVSALYSLPREAVFVALLAGHSISRFVSVSFLTSHQYVRDEQGKSKPLASAMSSADLTFSAVTLLPVLVLLWFYVGLVAIVWLAVILYFLKWSSGRYFVKRIGGFTGDCLGAVQQLAEVVVYLTLVALW